MQVETDHRRLMTEEEAAAYLSLSRGYMRRLRMVGSASPGPGPQFVRIGGAVRYDLHDLDTFIEQSKCGG